MAQSLFLLPPLPVPSPAPGADRDDRKQALAGSRKGEGEGGPLEHQLLSTPPQAPHLQASLAPGVSAPGQAGRRDLDERPDPRPWSGNAGLGDRGWRSGEIRPWGGGEGSGSQSQGQTQPTGGLILPNSPPQTTK